MSIADIPDIFDEDDEELEDEDIDNDEDETGFEIVVEPDEDFDEDELKELEKQLNKLQKFGEKHLVGKGKRSYSKQKNEILRQIKNLVNKMDFLLLSNAFIKTDTYSAYLRRREELRKGLLKSLLGDEDDDVKIIIMQELLQDFIGDDEAAESYIQ